MNSDNTLQRYLSPLGAWAFAVGTAVGWGSLMATAGNYLSNAGPAGSVIGMLIGTLIMLIVGWNYAYLMRAYPEAGGAYAYAREILGHEYGFIAAWFLTITYLAILWANATALPLFGRLFMGRAFEFGRLYTVFGYDVYLGEALLSMAAMALIGLLCARQARAAGKIMTGLVILFAACIAGCFVGGMATGHAPMRPAFIPDEAILTQLVRTAVISSWAFIGFESISHSAEEFRFPLKKIPRIMMIAVITTILIYVFVVLMSVMAYPPEYDSWLAYIGDLDHQEGLAALPAFYAANHFLGRFGVALLMISLLALVITSLIGNITALSRLFCALARDEVLPPRFAEISSRGIPVKAVLLVVAFSILIPLAGRTAIGWVVDVTCIGATIIYGLVCITTARTAKDMGDSRERWTGLIGLILMIAFGTYLLLPGLIAHGSLAKETYFLFIIWSILGFLFFRSILRRDNGKNFGASLVVWVAVLALVLLISLIWMRQSMIATSELVQENILNYYAQQGTLPPDRTGDAEFIVQQISAERSQDTRTMVIAVGMFLFALFVMLSNHSFMDRRSRESEMLANVDPMTGVKSKHAFLMCEKDHNGQIAKGEAMEFAIAVCDVNGLKKINDTLGHKAGDEYIRESSRMICDIFQHSPVYRIGGDEFAVIVTERDYNIRKELMIALHDRSVTHINEGGAVISGGISEFVPGEDTSFHDVFERADAEMYTEKKLLKSLGAATRDGEEEESELRSVIPEEPAVLNIKRHILIVEDEKVNQMMLGNILKDSYEMLYADNGLEALEQIRENRDDLAMVLLDLQMPKMNGREVLQILSEDQDLQNIPVIVLTADQSAEVECLGMGAIDFIPKPYPSPEIVRARVDRCIELSEDRSIIESTERDDLTGLFNVEHFMRYVRLYDQHYRDMAMDAVVIDINDFHLINERFGKQYGDTVLHRAGERIRKVARRVGGVGCRRGADIFMLYCPHTDDYSEMLESISEGLDGGDGSVNRVRLRLGVYSNVDKALEIDRRFEYARTAANNVKGNLLRPIGVYDIEMHEKELLKARLLEEFKPALESEQFKVFFQPKFDIRPEVPILKSAEALVRWVHPELGVISPGMFIPMLEENGLILELDKYVWRRTAARIRDWKDRLGFSVPVSVNVSRIDIMMPNIRAILQGILDDYDLKTEDVILEITESAYIGDSDHVISAVKDLRGMGMGFRIEMDDFGTGYSSLGMLTRLPLDALKLDMSFVRSAFGETRDLRIIELIIEIADYLDVPVVAEGVETEEQYLTLKEMGCDLVQGYFFSRPVPPEEFEKFLLERIEAQEG